jgi:hypothetical protein
MFFLSASHGFTELDLVMTTTYDSSDTRINKKGTIRAYETVTINDITISIMYK